LLSAEVNYLGKLSGAACADGGANLAVSHHDAGTDELRQVSE
jgi:hypothetical protein